MTASAQPFTRLRPSVLLCSLVLGFVAVDSSGQMSVDGRNTVPLPPSWPSLSSRTIDCILESSGVDAEIADEARRSFERYDAAWANTITPLKERADRFGAEVAMIQADLAEQGPIASSAADAFEAHSAFRRDAIAMDVALRDDLSQALGDDSAIMEGWWLSRTVTHARAGDESVWFGRSDPIELAARLLTDSELAESSACSRIANLWRQLARPSDLRNAALRYRQAASQFQTASETSFTMRSRMLDAVWERSVVMHHDRNRSEALLGQAEAALLEWTRSLIEPGLALDQAERGLIDALDRWLPDELGPRLRDHWRTASFGILWSDPVSPATTLEAAVSDPTLPGELRTQLAGIIDEHRTRTRPMSMQLVESEMEDWPIVLRSREDEYHLRLGILAERADLLISRRSAHLEAWAALAESLRAFGLEPPALPQANDATLDPLLREVKPYTLSGSSYREVAESFLRMHRERNEDPASEWP